MATLKYFIYLCLCMSPIHGYYKSYDDVGTAHILAVQEETIDIICESDVPISRCEFTHPNGTRISINQVSGASSCMFTIKATSSEHGLWTCHIWGRTSQEQIYKNIYVMLGIKEPVSDLRSDFSETITDDGPIVISSTMYVCSIVAFLVIFVALVYWKYRYYTVYYGKTWGDDDSIDSRVMNIRADPTAVINAGNHLLII